MIRKVINSDNTFGANYDEALAPEYKTKGIYPEENYLELTADQALTIDSEPDRYVYQAGVPGLFLGYPMGVVERSDYQERQYEKVRMNKYSEITNGYDYANQYYVCNLYGNMYGNVSWLTTWNKVIELCEANKQTTVPSAVRLYQKEAGASKFKNVNVENVSVSDLKRYKSLLDQVQFTILQPKRNAFYKQLEGSKTIKEINDIVVNYGFTINEQDSSDVANKVEL